MIPPITASLSSLDATDGAILASVIGGMAPAWTARDRQTGAIDDSTLYGGLLTLKTQLEHFPTSRPIRRERWPRLAAVECGLDNTSVKVQRFLARPGGCPRSCSVVATEPISSRV